MITKQMAWNYLGDDYHEWIANVITDICNDPSDINVLRKEILEHWEEHLKNSKGDKWAAI